MSLKAKIEAVIYASEEPVTLAQLVGLLGDEAQAELDRTGFDPADALAERDGSGGGRRLEPTTVRRGDAGRTNAAPDSVEPTDWRTRPPLNGNPKLRLAVDAAASGARGRRGRAWPGCARTFACCWTS